jgi:hypothetical protein
MRVGLIGKRELNRLNVLARLSSKTDRCSCGRRSSNIRWSDDVHDQATVLVRNVRRPSIFTAGPSKPHINEKMSHGTDGLTLSTYQGKATSSVAFASLSLQTL